MEKTTFETAMHQCENAIRALKPNPLPQDIILVGELVNYWLKSYNVITILKNSNDYGHKKDEQ